MSLDLTLNLQGLPDLLAKLDRMDIAAQQAILLPAVEEGAEILRADAANRAPRDTGALAEGMTMTVVKKEPHYVSVKVGPDRKQFYGRFIENGTAHIAPRPFLGPALTTNRERILTLIRERIANAIGKA